MNSLTPVRNGFSIAAGLAALVLFLAVCCWDSPATAASSKIPSLGVGADGGEAEKPNLDVDELLGTWRAMDGDWPLVLLPEGEGEAPTAFTLKREWTVKVNPKRADGAPVDEDGPGRLTLTVKPKADEMNPEAPPWARALVEGKLEWRVEVFEHGTCGTPKLKMKWYPGEIAWREDGEGEADGAEVRGDGEPREFILEQANDIIIEPVRKPEVLVWAPLPPSARNAEGRNKVLTKVSGAPASGKAPPPLTGDRPSEQEPVNPRLAPIDALVKAQPFYVEVILPKEMAEQQGGTLDVALTNKTSGDDYTITLRAMSAPEREQVVYIHGDAIMLGDAADRLALGTRDANILSLNPGSVLDFDVDNGDRVEFAFNDATHAVSVYDTPELRAIAKYRTALREAANVFGSFLQRGDVSDESKTQFYRRLLMVKNAQLLIDMTDKFIPKQRYAIGKAYLGEALVGGMVFRDLSRSFLYYGTLDGLGGRKEFRWHDRSTPMGQRQSRGFPGVLWTSHFEQITVERAITRNKADKGEILTRALTVMAMASYQFTNITSNAGDLYTIIFGVDPMTGRPVNITGRFMAVGGLATGVAVSGGLKYINTRMTTRTDLGHRSLGSLFRSKKKVRPGRRSGPMPKLLDSKEVTKDLHRRYQQKNQPGDGPTCAEPPTHFTPVPAHPELFSNPSIKMPEAKFRAGRLYGEEAANVRGFDHNARPVQTGQNCQIEAINRAHQVKTGENIEQVDAIKMMKEMDYVNQGTAQGQLESVGVHDGVPRQYAADLGWTEMGSYRAQRISDLDWYYRQDMAVKVTIRYDPQVIGKNDAYHAVNFEGVVRNGKGEITHAVIYDSNVGSQVEVKACVFKDLINHGYDNAQVFSYDLF